MRWNFNNLDGWRISGKSQSRSNFHLGSDGLRIHTRAGTRDRVKVCTEQRYGLGVYRWRVYTPQMGEGDQASIGAFIYLDDRHEFDFEIGYGKAVVRTELNAERDDLICYATCQDGPHSSTQVLVKTNTWHNLTLELRPGERGLYKANWRIDGETIKRLQTTFDNCSFTIYCSVENLKFIGDHLPKQDNYGLFAFVEYVPFVE